MNGFLHKLSDILSSIPPGKADPGRYYNSVIIAAAGSGTRMGQDGGKTKQMISLCGIPVVARTIMQFEACPFVREIIVAAREDELGLYGGFAAEYGFRKITAVVKGGPTRQNSVLLGFRHVSPKAEYVAVHDGARCLVTPAMIEAVFLQAYIYGSAAAAVRPKDTVKKADKDGFITETLDRAFVWHAQTPQVFKTGIYRAAAYIAEKDGFAATDDCMLAENIGFRVRLVDCGEENIKITTPGDLTAAEAILRRREKSEKRESDV